MFVLLALLGSGCSSAEESSASRSTPAPPLREPLDLRNAQRQLRAAGFGSSGSRLAAVVAASSPSQNALAESIRLVGLADRAATETLASLLPPDQEMYLAAVWNTWSRAELGVYGELGAKSVPLCETPGEENPTASSAGGTVSANRPVVDSPGEERQSSEERAVAADTDDRALEAARELADWLQLAWGEARSSVVVGYLSRAMEARKCVVYLASTCRTRQGEPVEHQAVEGVARNAVDSILWEVRLLDYLAVSRFWTGDGPHETLPLGPQDLESLSSAVETAFEAWRLWQDASPYRGGNRGEGERCPSNPSWKEQASLRSLEMVRSRARSA